FDLLFRQQSIMQRVDEWRPVDFSTGNGKVALITILALLVAALFSRRQWRLDEVLLMAFALWAALSHERFLFFAGLIAAPILAPRLELFPPYDRERDKPWLNAAIMTVITGSLIFVFLTVAQLQEKVSREYPTSALEFMQRQHISGNIFNFHLWGVYMEWYALKLKPFIDGRSDIFVYNGTFDDYLNAMRIDEPFETLDKYKIDYAFLAPDQSLAYILERS